MVRAFSPSAYTCQLSKVGTHAAPNGRAGLPVARRYVAITEEPLVRHPVRDAVLATATTLAGHQPSSTTGPMRHNVEVTGGQ
jgi:hypothetical protein